MNKQKTYTYFTTTPYDGYDLLIQKGLDYLYKYCKTNNVVCNEFTTWLDPLLHPSLFEGTMQIRSKVNKFYDYIFKITNPEIYDSSKLFSDGNVYSMMPLFEYCNYNTISSLTLLSRDHTIRRNDIVEIGSVDDPDKCIIFINGGAQLVFDYRIYNSLLSTISDELGMKIYYIRYTKDRDLACAALDWVNKVTQLYIHAGKKVLYLTESSGSTLMVSIMFKLHDMIEQDIKAGNHTSRYSLYLPHKCVMLNPGFLEEFNLSPGRLASINSTLYSNPRLLAQQRMIYNIDYRNILNLHELARYNITIILARNDTHIDFSLYFANKTKCKLIYSDIKHAWFTNMRKKKLLTNVLNIIYSELTLL